MVNRNITSIALLTLIAFLLSACELGKKGQVVDVPVQEATPTPVKPAFSAEAIIPASKDDVRLAQRALNELGFKVGSVDGFGARVQQLKFDCLKKNTAL